MSSTQVVLREDFHSIRLHSEPINPDALLREKHVAALVDTSPKTVESWRFRGGGPPFIRLNARSVRYRYGDVVEWIEQRRRISTADASVREAADAVS